MSNFRLDWNHIPSEWSSAISRRTDELYAVDDALLDDEGLITCSVLPLRDVVLFPNMVTPLFVSHEPSLLAVEEAIQNHETLIAIAQHDPDIEHPGPKDLYAIGTEIAVGRLMQIPDGTTSVLTQGRRRVEIVEYVAQTPYLRVRARPIEESLEATKETLALMRAVLTLFEKCVELNRSLPEEAYLYAANIEEPAWLADLIVSALTITLPERQEILEIFDPVERLQKTSVLLGRELDVLELEDQIHTRVQDQVDRSQREIYLREQMKAIQSELGEADLWTQEISELRERIQHLSLPDEVETVSLKEIQRLSHMPSLSPEVGIIRTYLDWLTGLPWGQITDDNLDIRHVAQILESQHHGLKQPKERILEYIAVKSLAPAKQRQPILCFVGPPGTGKTSLGRSIAEALGRKFVRISLGGIRDESEIRGHRRTYIGAMPGRILQGMRRGETANPLFMLDEIDKLGRDFRGDPAAALLEVLDPEQNHAFSDHYLEIPYDLSKVLFITTANTTETVPPALLDRLELIEFPGYIEEEKLVIAEKFLIPRQIEQNGLSVDEVKFTQGAVKAMIREYTWEAGVRNLEREIGKICRKVARRKAEKRKVPHRLLPSMLPKLLGPPQILPHEAEVEDQVGAATGLAWTENGGDSLTVEALLMEGKGELQITGQVGDVMRESVLAALSYIKSRASQLGIDPEIFEKTDVHIHVPEGAIPKDGPSAGITMATALASAFTKRAVRRDVGMSGEITLRGRVLPIGGVRDKILAAYRLKLGSVIIPEKNEKDLAEIPRQARAALQIHLVEHMDQVLEIGLRPQSRKPARRVKTTKTSSSRKKTT
jgi:ATP-dependent Lon protease